MSLVLQTLGVMAVVVPRAYIFYAAFSPDACPSQNTCLAIMVEGFLGSIIWNKIGCAFVDCPRPRQDKKAGGEMRAAPCMSESQYLMYMH